MNIKQLSPFIFVIIILNLNPACSKEAIEDAPLVPKSITYFAEDEISSVTDFTYDNENKIIEERNTIFMDDSYNTLFLFRYNNAGRVIKREYYSKQGYSYYTTFEYDSSGKLIEQARYEEGERLANYRVYYYNNLNQVDSVYEFSNERIRTGRIYYKYDARGNRIEEVSYYIPNMKFQFYEFDDKPNIYSGLKSYHPENVYNNNRLKKIYPTISFDGLDIHFNIDENTTYDHYSYEYNEKGYPIKTSIEGSSSYQIIEYYN